MGVILTALFAVISANALWELLSILVSGIFGEKERDMSDKYVTLDEFMNERGEWVKQVVYKVDGDFNGDIKGENVTVILMGNGNINGNIDAKNGEVFVHHGNINGNVKADKVLCPTPPIKKTCESCRYYMPHDNKRHFWCTQGGMLHFCIKEYTTVCKYYKDKNNH